jgi:hypothetical protein
VIAKEQDRSTPSNYYHTRGYKRHNLEGAEFTGFYQSTLFTSEAEPSWPGGRGRVKCKKNLFIRKKRMQDKMYIDENLSDGLDLDDEDFGLKFAPSELILLPLLQDLEKKYGGARRTSDSSALSFTTSISAPSRSFLRSRSMPEVRGNI